MHDESATILDIVLACRRISRFITGADEATFLADEQKRWAVVSQLSIIGEAVRRLSDGFRDSHSGVPWRQIAGTRDRLIHAYDKIDWPLVWKPASIDVQNLAATLETLLPPE
jgi:uncharacterized protein with HEPN domain